MIRLDDIQPLTGFLRESKDFIKKLTKSGRPTVLTVNGKAALVVQDIQSYQKLMEKLERATSNGK